MRSREPATFKKSRYYLYCTHTVNRHEWMRENPKAGGKKYRQENSGKELASNLGEGLPLEQAMREMEAQATV